MDTLFLCFRCGHELAADQVIQVVSKPVQGLFCERCSRWVRGRMLEMAENGASEQFWETGGRLKTLNRLDVLAGQVQAGASDAPFVPPAEAAPKKDDEGPKKGDEFNLTAWLAQLKSQGKEDARPPGDPEGKDASQNKGEGGSP